MLADLVFVYIYTQREKFLNLYKYIYRHQLTRFDPKIRRIKVEIKKGGLSCGDLLQHVYF